MPAHAELSTVGHLHDLIYATHGVVVPIPAGVQRSQPHSLRYMYAKIDAANFLLNGCITNYQSRNYIPGRSAPSVVAISRVVESVAEFVRSC